MSHCQCCIKDFSWILMDYAMVVAYINHPGKIGWIANYKDVDLPLTWEGIPWPLCENLVIVLPQWSKSLLWLGDTLWDPSSFQVWPETALNCLQAQGYPSLHSRYSADSLGSALSNIHSLSFLSSLSLLLDGLFTGVTSGLLILYAMGWIPASQVGLDQRGALRTIKGLFLALAYPFGSHMTLTPCCEPWYRPLMEFFSLWFCGA